VEPACFLARRSAKNLIENFHPVRIGMGEVRYGPVAAIHDAAESKTVDHMRDIGNDLFSFPVRVVRLGHDSRDLAYDIRKSGQLLDLAAPWLGETVFDVWLTDVIEHERHFGASLDQLERIDQAPVLLSDIEAEAVFR